MAAKRLLGLALAALVVPACGGGGGGSQGPAVTGVLPAEAKIGDAITVSGRQFGDIQGASTLTIAGVTAVIVSWSDTQIQATVPVGAQSGAVVVNLPAGPSAAGFLFILWTAPPTVNVPVCTASGTERHPRIASDAAGGAIIVWDDLRGADRDIYAQRVDSSGTPLWTANGIPICTLAEHQVDPEIVSDGAGGAIIVWGDNRIAATGPDLYAQRVDANGNLLWAANGVNVCNEFGTQLSAKVAPDGSGGALLTWIYAGGGGTGNNVYAQRVSAAGVPLWVSTGATVSALPGNQSMPQVVPDGTGGGIFVFEHPAGVSDDIYAQRLDGTGVALWGANGIPACAAPDRQLRPQLAPDGGGGAIFVWQDYRVDGVNSDLYAQRIDAGGSVRWTTDGVSVSSAGNFQGAAQIVSDGAGGAVIAWEDNRSTASNLDIYAQRLNGQGVVQWTVDGLVVATATWIQNQVHLVPDGTGGAIISWDDGRNDISDVYAQRITGAGVPVYPPNGAPVSMTAGRQEDQEIAPDGAGGAVILWLDDRGPSQDVYAQGISPSGQ